MTKAIEELCAGLKARGVEYRIWDEPEEDICYAQWEADGFNWEAEDRDGRMYLCADRLITPEQVIAATLKPMKLTGKLVGDVAENNWHDLMAECGSREYVSNGYSQLPQEGYDWDAIAKSLNGMLEQGTCALSVIDKGCDSASDWMKTRHWVFDEVYQCSCGCYFGMASINRPNYCPNCGRRITEVEK